MKKQVYDLRCPRCSSPARLLETKSKDGNSSDFKYESSYVMALAALKNIRNSRATSPEDTRHYVQSVLVALGEII